MRHNDARKWLHAGLDLLPLILIPVFMIYSHRHTIDSGSIEVPINRVVDFNQLMPNDKINFSYSGVNPAFEDYATLNLIGGHKYAFKFTPNSYPANPSGAYTFYLYNFSSGQSTIYQVNNEVYTINLNTTATLGYATYNIDNNYYQYEGTINYYDLTQMFGSGNEPTYDEFATWYSADYYDYTLSSKQLLKGYSTLTYNDTDIMSQFTYQLYNSVDKYFNMGNVFNLGGVYDWFNLNIFSGNAPIAVYIVWQVVLYEFVMDLLFLLYGLFMWFIDMCKHLMEKPFRSIK